MRPRPPHPGQAAPLAALPTFALPPSETGGEHPSSQPYSHCLRRYGGGEAAVPLLYPLFLFEGAIPQAPGKSRGQHSTGAGWQVGREKAEAH